MSWYYNYYIGRKVNDEIELIGIYDNKGKIHPALEISHSFASSLHDKFYHYDDERLKKELDDGIISILPYRDLPTEDFIKRGYFLIEDVEKYLEDGNTWDIFYDYISPQVYAEKLKTECLLGRPSHVKLDEKGLEFETEEDTRSCRDYMYFAYPDYQSEGYEAFLLRSAVGMIEPYDTDNIVIVLSEG